MAPLDGANGLASLELGDKLRVWRWATPDEEHGEWAEVIWRAEREGGIEWLFCETLRYSAFWFAPQRVAEGTDSDIRRYAPASELTVQRTLFRTEAARLHAALDEDCGVLRELKAPLPPGHRGFTTAPSQLRVKATVLNGDLKPREREELQERLQRRLEREAELREMLQEGAVLSSPCSPARREQQNRRHRPELCAACIRKQSWCSGSLHRSDCAVRLDRAVRRLHPQLRWSACEAGVEALINYGGELVILQLRPWIFCVSDDDALLFGVPGLPELPKKESKAASSASCAGAEEAPSDGEEATVGDTVVERYFSDGSESESATSADPQSQEDSSPFWLAPLKMLLMASQVRWGTVVLGIAQ
mmetsp:Transcript_8985/g.23210  ORF Transcript_8985/g.23210 Transcript_8985/m.23210 type:complete len:361 (-) Transcript_8985:307-1389(-)|eukprot:CAMPEP_0195086890 /NCGR_PEP_ID=MMETSP0448-20130528/26888_1 /TAXON_ID=66468 /ORGANISM="Heterocapsa triquestra, Strain CCMP 448" /LENGTH=360 /DNA_ID=CAMNT_0040120407 /DNA_START=109 /DNA_END=1191 /DNA_ORIENTATION=-